jgi:sigma-B regulation protein RsbU (phosphoserine phosphatase)
MNSLNVESLVLDKNKPLEQLNLLTSLFHDFSSSLDLEATLKRATQLIKKYLNAEGTALFLLDNKDKELVCQSSSSESDITGIRINADQGIIGRALRENQTQIVRDVTEDTDFFSGVDKQTGMTTRSVLCAPLMVKDHKLGALEAINKNSDDGLFNDQDSHGYIQRTPGRRSTGSGTYPT